MTSLSSGTWINRRKLADRVDDLGQGDVLDNQVRIWTRPTEWLRYVKELGGECGRAASRFACEMLI